MTGTEKRQPKTFYTPAWIEGNQNVVIFLEDPDLIFEELKEGFGQELALRCQHGLAKKYYDTYALQPFGAWEVKENIETGTYDVMHVTGKVADLNALYVDGPAFDQAMDKKAKEQANIKQH